MAKEMILELKNISKNYQGVHALKDVNFFIRRGMVNVLIGENGAGKSTLMKILSGAEIRDSGQIIFEDRPIEIKSPVDSMKHGIAMIYQEFNLVQELTVFENICLGREYGPLGFLKKEKEIAHAKQILKEYEIDLDPHAMVENLSTAEQQMLEIAKALSSNVRIIVMDEPTSSLTIHEVKHLFEIIGRLIERGITIVFISHRLEEVFAIGDYVTVLRDGSLIGEWKSSDITPDDLISAIVGRKIEQLYPKIKIDIGDVLLEVRGLTKAGLFEDVSFNLRRGEILGMAGLVGAGRTEVMLSIFGYYGHDSGQIILNGREVSFKGPKEAMKNKIAYLSEDRKRYGIDLNASIRNNISITNLDRLTKLGFVKSRKEREFSDNAVSMLRIKTWSILEEVKNLSGGNQQKVALVKWISRNVDVLILDEPTRGIDVGAKEEIHKLMGELVSKGIGIILISSELPEVLGMSDRIVVMHEGKMAAVVDSTGATQEGLMVYMMGHTDTQKEGV